MDVARDLNDAKTRSVWREADPNPKSRTKLRHIVLVKT